MYTGGKMDEHVAMIDALVRIDGDARKVVVAYHALTCTRITDTGATHKSLHVVSAINRQRAHGSTNKSIRTANHDSHIVYSFILPFGLPHIPDL